MKTWNEDVIPGVGFQQFGGLVKNGKTCRCGFIRTFEAGLPGHAGKWTRCKGYLECG